MTGYRGLTGEEALRSFAPGPASALDRLVGARSIDPTLTALCRRACAEVLELTALPAPPGAHSQTGDGYERDVVAFCEQFSLDVSRIDVATTRRVGEAVGEGPELDRGGIVASTYVADFVPRVRAALDALFSPSGPWSAVPEVVVQDLTPLCAGFVREVHRLKGLDPVTSEVIRLRGAAAHDCRLCRSIRSSDALVAGADESTFSSIERFAQSDLPRQQKVALELVDALIWRPARLPAELLDRVRAEFDPELAVELVLDVMKNAWNKSLVALGRDAARVSEGFDVYQIHDDGSIEFGLDMPVRD